jgi:hypothetical protein
MSERDLDPLDPDLSRLLAAERGRPPEAPEKRARIRLRVEATLGLGPLDGGGGNPEGGADPAHPEPPDLPSDGGLPASGLGASGAAAGSALSGVTKLFVGGLLAAAFAGAGASARGGLLSPAPPGRPSMTAAPALGPGSRASLAEAAEVAKVQSAPRAEVISAPREAAEPVEAAAPPAAAAAAAAAAGPSAEADSNKAGRDDSLAAERALLEVARSAVIAGQSGAALSALGRHARAFPRGRLSEEREGLWIRVLIGAGRLDEARQRAARFRKSFPRSMLIPSFEEALGTIP